MPRTAAPHGAEDRRPVPGAHAGGAAHPGDAPRSRVRRGRPRVPQVRRPQGRHGHHRRPEEGPRDPGRAGHPRRAPAPAQGLRTAHPAGPAVGKQRGRHRPCLPGLSYTRCAPATSGPPLPPVPGPVYPQARKCPGEVGSAGSGRRERRGSPGFPACGCSELHRDEALICLRRKVPSNRLSAEPLGCEHCAKDAIASLTKKRYSIRNDNE
jgi:hypothetical protein